MNQRKITETLEGFSNLDILETSFENSTDGYILSGCDTGQKIKFSITYFFSNCDQIRSFLWIWSHLLKIS